MAIRTMANIMDETEGISNVSMTENRDIPDHPWPYMREMFEIVSVKKDPLRMHYLSINIIFVLLY